MVTDIRLKENLPVLTERIVDTYAEVDQISHLGHSPLPNYETVIAAAEDLKEILYPGYRRRDGLHLGNITYHIGDLIDRLHDTLTVQIARDAAARGRRPLEKKDYLRTDKHRQPRSRRRRILGPTFSTAH